MYGVEMVVGNLGARLLIPHHDGVAEEQGCHYQTLSASGSSPHDGTRQLRHADAFVGGAAYRRRRPKDTSYG
jgi:hypothetical protein